MSENRIDPITGNDYEEMYLDYFNDYLSVDAFAEDYSLSIPEAMVVINKGRALNQKR